MKLSTLIILFLLILGNLSCKKNKDKIVQESVLKYKVNGVQYEKRSKTDITFSFIGFIQTVGQEIPTYFVKINSPFINIELIDETEVIQTGSYIGKEWSSDNKLRACYISFSDPTINEGTLFIPNYNTPLTRVDLVSISKDGMKGTFSATLSEEYTSNIVEITDGSFEVYTYK